MSHLYSVRFSNEEGEDVANGSRLYVQSVPTRGDQLLLPGRSSQWDRYEVLYCIWQIDRIDPQATQLSVSAVEVVVRLMVH